MECAGNGRALFAPRPVSQPWLYEAVGTGRWSGAPLATVLDRARLEPEAVEVLFSGLDRGVEGGEEQVFQRSLPLEIARADDVLLAYELNGGPLPPQHGFPLRLLVPGWYGMTNVKWLTRITALDTPFTGYQQARGYRLRADETIRASRYPDPAAGADGPAWLPDFMTRERTSTRAGRRSRVARGRATRRSRRSILRRRRRS